MSAPKEDKIQVRQFKDKSSHWFVNYAHYYLNENNELLWAAGESDNKEYRDVLEAYCKRNKKIYAPREIVPIIEYNEIVTFGKYSNKTVQYIYDNDRSWLKWARDNYNFSSAQNNLKEQILNILK